jgi:23S rRNA (pseudouridine1915-N3)-methyltransferase
MRLLIAAVGRLKDGAEQELYTRYVGRIAGYARQIALGPLDLIELSESKASRADERKADEAQRLIKAVGSADFRICLDERGQSQTSVTFSNVLTKRRDDGCSTAAFLIGGADGHGQAVFDTSHVLLSLSPMTLPHGLARVVLAEQLYRAATIAAGHPYHRI